MSGALAKDRRSEIFGVFVLAGTLLLFLALATDGLRGSPNRPLDGLTAVQNALGATGAWVAAMMVIAVGRAAHLLYCITAVWGFMLLRHYALDRFGWRLAGLIMLVASGSALLNTAGPWAVAAIAGTPLEAAAAQTPPVYGGLLGGFLGSAASKALGPLGAAIVSGALLLTGMLLATDLLLLHVFTGLGKGLLWLARAAGSLLLRGGVSIGRTLRATARAGFSASAGLFRTKQKGKPTQKPQRKRVNPREPAVGEAAPMVAAVLPETDPVAPNPDLPIEPEPAAMRTQGGGEIPELPWLDPPVQEEFPEPPNPAKQDGSTDAAIAEETPAADKEPPAIRISGMGFAAQDMQDNASPADRQGGAPPVKDLRAQLAEGKEALAEFRARLASEREQLATLHERLDEVDIAPPPDEEETTQEELESALEGLPRQFRREAPLDEAFGEDSGGGAAYTPADWDKKKDAAQTPELDAEAAPVPSAAAPAKAMPRRKTADDPLPPDYVYPKRYTKPPLDIFDPPPEHKDENIGDLLLRTSALLEETLRTFKIEAKVKEITRGPTITRYELEPAPGIKVSRFTALADDLALALRAHRVRIVAPIPGKGRVGVELPNKTPIPVVFRELMESKTYAEAKGVLKLAVGKDIAGDVVVEDLARMPHLLVAGATGAGKTVCVKTMIASLLCTHTPDELQCIFVDPKMVELSIFNDIPHLITPVVTDPKKAAIALRWLISEMEERYRLFTHLRVRNIEVYNESVENGEIEMPGEDEEAVNVVRKLPYIVCIIDELADLMMLARAEVEDAIARLAQLARAVGIHLIIATQRPSVDVLTGVIKANFPARVSFQVSSKVDSRCILDQIGAERLIGRGDMLMLPAGHAKPVRVQGAFVSDEEMNELIAYLKTQAPPQYKEEIEQYGGEQGELANFEDEDDELFDDAVRVVVETGQASISMVQRRLRVGYTRAARLIDMMEMKGIVGPHVGSKAREILVPCAPDCEG